MKAMILIKRDLGSVRCGDLDVINDVKGILPLESCNFQTKKVFEVPMIIDVELSVQILFDCINDRSSEPMMIMSSTHTRMDVKDVSVL